MPRPHIMRVGRALRRTLFVPSSRICGIRAKGRPGVEGWFGREVRIEAGGEYSALTIRFAESGCAVVEWQIP